MKLFITGCAKTGTTLVRRLFNAFNLKVYNFDEIGIEQFYKSNYNVGKRVGGTIFSNDISENVIKHQLNYIKKYDIKIINCLRDRSDVLKSSNNYVPEKRFNACIDQAQKYSDYIDYTINYKDLINNPNQIQTQISDYYNLEIIHNWSDYPKFIDINQENPHTKLGNYKLRKLGENY